jgi:phosphoglycolate phosphatase
MNVMAHRFRLIVFDFDGTLVDSQGMIVRAMTESFQAFGLAPPTPETVRRMVGLTLERAVADLLPDPVDTATVARVAEGYRQAYFTLRTRPDYHEPLFEGAREVLARLDEPEVCLGIATGKAMRGLLAGLERHGLAHHFVTLQTSDTAPGKPHPGMLRRAMAEVGAGPDDTVLIGDTTFDMEMARNARTPGIGVDWGYHDREELLASGAAMIVDRFADLPDALAVIGAVPA